MMQCLVVDDFEIIRKVARRILEDNGYTVIESASAAQALEQCQAEMPNVILLDWLTPGMTALEFMTGLRQLTRGTLPSVIYCTSEVDKDDCARMIAAGAAEILVKPFDRLMLLSKLAKLASGAQAA